MLSTIIFDIHIKDFSQIIQQGIPKNNRFFQSLENNRIHLEFFCENSQSLTTYLNTFSLQKENLLFVSDCTNHLLTAKTLGFFCVGYDDGSTFLPVDYCFQDFSSVDTSYFTKILCRYKKEPLSIITTRHLQIRELSPKDLPSLYAIYQEPEIRTFLPEGKTNYGIFYQKRCSYIEKIYPFYDFGMWGIFLKENQSLIGECGLQPLSIDNKDEIAIGYVLSSKFQKQGLGREMVRATLRYAYREFDFSRIVAQIHPDNFPSIALANSCGFHYEKTCQDSTLLFSYEHATQTELQSPKKTADITKKVYDSYQKKPDTSVYGKRY